MNSGSTQNTSVDWFNRALYDSFTTSSVDWEGRVLYDSSTVTCIDWSGRNLADSTGANSVEWEVRYLRTPGSVKAFTWGENDYVAGSQIYQSRTIAIETQDLFSNNILTYSGQAISATIDNSSNAGELVYLSGSNIWYPIDQTTDASTNMLGINIDGINVLLEGDIVLDNVDGTTFGAPLYIQEGGVILSSQIPTSGYVRVLGHLYYQNTTTLTNYIVKFRPSNDWYEI